MSDRVEILGSKISVWDLEETVTRLRKLAESDGRHYICISNVHTVVTGAQDPAYAAVTNGATLATADGVPLIWASRLLGGPRIHGRASGPDILLKILQDSACRNIRHYFYGSTSEVLDALKQRIAKIAPGAQVCGYDSPPMRPARTPSTPMEEAELADCRRIEAASPHMVWVGLGAPKQEIWMARARAHLKAPVLVGVGAAFDFLADRKRRAPAWMRESGLEWLFRLSQEPRRLARRYIVTNPLFVAGVLRQVIQPRERQQ